MGTFNALGGPSRVSKSAQMQALSVPRQITKRKIPSVDFLQGLRVERSPVEDLYANDCTFNDNTVAESRLRLLTEPPKMRLEKLVLRSSAGRT